MPPKLKWTNHSDLAIERRPSVHRDEYLDHMTFQRNDRPLFTEIFGPIIGLKEEWEKQGATPAELDFTAYPFRCEARHFVTVNTGRHGGPPQQTLEDTDEHLIYRDELGRTMKLAKGYSTLALPQDYPVANMDDWLNVKPLYEFDESRFAQNWLADTQRARDEGKVIYAGIPGGFDEPRQLMGEEGLCYALCEQPELVHDILRTIGDTATKVLDRVSAQVRVDMLGVHEDMAGKSGPLIGPAHVRQFVAPYYRRVWDMLADRGTRLFDQDSDGDMNPVIDAFLDAGINCMHPLEPAANMDMVKIRERYGTRLAFYGGIDKHVLRRSHDEIVAELEYKIPPMVATGGCVIALDHRIPNGTPLESYRFYIRKAWKILNREASHQHGHLQ
jgi:hypothetical protein